jgi:hypothetical protein
MSGRTLVVATWGHPARWYNVLYSVGTKVQDFRCCTSLIPLLRYLEGEGEGVDVVLVALDSLGRSLEDPLIAPATDATRVSQRSSRASPGVGTGSLGKL